MANFANYSTGNTKRDDSVNTRGLQMKNKNGIVNGSTLLCDFWNERLNITMHPVLKNPTEKQVYDYEQRIQLTLTVDKAMGLLKAIDTKIDNALQTGEETSVAVTSGADNMLVVSTVKFQDSMYVVLTICRELNPETRLPGQRFTYTFLKDDEVVLGFDPEKGNFEGVMEVQTEYELFKKVLEEFCGMRTNASNHGDRFNDRFYRTSLVSRVSKIGEKLGVLDSGNGNGSYNKSSSFANVDTSNSNSGGGNQTATLDELGNIFG